MRLKSTLEDRATLDGAAAALSNLCLLHCLALPLLAALLPILVPVLAPVMASGGDSLHGPAWLHWLLLGVALPVSGYALWRGMESHGGRLPLLLAGLGFPLMAAGALLHDNGLVEPTLTVAGGLLVAFAHWKNWTARPA